MTALQQQLADTIGLHEAMALAIESEKATRAARDTRDSHLSAIGNVLRHHGKKSYEHNGIEVKIVPVTILVCKCHQKHVERCETALAGTDVGVERRLGERIRIKRVSPC